MSMFDPAKVFLGITPTGWTNDDRPLLGNDIPFEQCVSEMALAGFQGCSVGHKYPTDTDTLKRELDLRCLRVSEPWASLYFTANEMRQQTLDYFQKQLDFIKTMGGTDLVVAELNQAVHQQQVSPLPNKPNFNDEQWKRLTDGLNEIGGIAANAGMQVCYHPHVGTGVEKHDEIARLMSETNPDTVHLLLDTGHLKFAGEDPLAITREFADRVRHCHLKNIREAKLREAIAKGTSFLDAVENGVFTVPGDPEGSIDFKPILQTLADHGFTGWLVVEAEQDAAKANPLKYAQMARRYLREITGV